MSFSLAASKILSLSLILGNVIMTRLGVFLFGSNFFGTLWASWTSWKSISFARLGKFASLLFQISFQFIALPLLLLASLGFEDVGTFKVVLEVPKPLLIFLNSGFFILFWLNAYFFLLLQTTDLSLYFLPALLVPCTFSFISFGMAFIFSLIL